MVANCFAPVRAMAVKQNWQIIPRVDSNAEVCSRQCGRGFMCTLTVVTNNETYLIAMNRDEKITRSAGLPLDIYEVGGARAIYPRDESGGTWLAVNEYGITLALLNWNDVAASGVLAKMRSRGQVIPALIGSRSLSDLHDVIHLSNFEGMLPFRLVGVFPFEQQIWEWRWDAKQVDSQLHLWQSRNWFSSSLSDERAESLRGAACRRAQNEWDAGSVPWLRRLHASHATGPGPFSLCVHRDDVKTLSYSEVSVTGKLIDMHHFRGGPCDMVANDTKGMIEIVTLARLLSESAKRTSSSLLGCQRPIKTINPPVTMNAPPT